MLLRSSLLLRFRVLLRLPLYPRLTDADEIRKSKEQFLQKIAFVDKKILNGLPIVKDHRLEMSEWEAGLSLA